MHRRLLAVEPVEPVAGAPGPGGEALDLFRAQHRAVEADRVRERLAASRVPSGRS